MNVEQALPVERCLAIEYPGYIASVEAALQSLGGSTEIAEAHTHRDDNEMKVVCRPLDELSHALYGTRKDVRRVLLQLSRPALDASSTAHASDGRNVTARVVAVVPTTYRFNSLADYQYVAAGQDAIFNGEEPTGPYGKESEPLLLVPPTFAHHDYPLEYGFRNFHGADGRTAVERQRVADGPLSDAGAFLRGTAFLSWRASLQYDPCVSIFILRPLSPGEKANVIPFEAATVPMEPEADAEERSSDDQQSASRVQDAFLERPVWSYQLLKDQWPSISLEALECALHKYCYQFDRGPWKGLWLRRGYDPRRPAASDAERKLARSYQSLDLKLPAKWYERMAQSAASDSVQRDLSQIENLAPGVMHAPALSAVHKFEALPMISSTQLQLCDLEDDTVRAVLAGEVAKAAQCRARTGWLTQKEHALLLQHVKSRLQGLADESRHCTH